MRYAFPFSAIVGQHRMKQAMILTAVDPGIGGVLVFGDRGTGKSTAVRALAALLPPIQAVEGSATNAESPEDVAEWDRMAGSEMVDKPTPVIDLPLGATEDRVVGALDIERAITHGEKAFEPGLLARANRGYLYIDEVNLLEDHIVDLLLDVAQSGENVIEREGLSVRHDARFVLVGSGNPEEGEPGHSFWIGSVSRSKCARPPISKSGSRSSGGAPRLRAIPQRSSRNGLGTMLQSATIFSALGKLWAMSKPERLPCAIVPNCVWRWALTVSEGS